MMAEVEDLVGDHLRHMRGQLDRMEHRLEDITARLGDVERSVADHSVKLAEINIKPDRASPASKSGLLSSRAIAMS
jgi:predicted  nucleic acid-binding Zn-ribbon protein